MLAVVDFSGRDCDSAWAADILVACGLNVRLPGGDIVTAIESQSPEASPAIILLAARIQLHERVDLMGKLGLNGAISLEIGDNELVVKAYEKWGHACADFLLGEFAFALWDLRIRRLFCCRDHVGAMPLFYWHQGNRFVAGSDPVRMLRLPGIPRSLNRRKLAALSVSGGQHYHHEETFHAGIMSLPGGCSLTVNREGMRKWKYWEPRIQPEMVPSRAEDAFAALRELLFRAVENRIQQKQSVAVLLSGGLDSSAIAAIAARILERRNLRLTGIAAIVPDGVVSTFGDEREFVEEFRSSVPNVDIEYVTAEGAGPFDRIESPAHFASTFLLTSREFLYDAFEKVARARGVDSILSGSLGELGPTFNGEGYYPELFLKLQWRTLWREMRALAAVRGGGAHRALAAQVRRLAQPTRNFVPLVALVPGFARECDSKAVGYNRTPNHRAQQLEAVRHSLRKHAIPVPTRLGPIPMSLPFSDKRVLEFCLAAGGDLKVRNGYSRYLVRGALEGMLPKKILWRTSKMDLSPDYSLRYNNQIDKARLMLDAVGDHDPVRSIVDVDSVRNLLRPVTGRAGMAMALSRVPATIQLICFLRQFREFQI